MTDHDKCDLVITHEGKICAIGRGHDDLKADIAAFHLKVDKALDAWQSTATTFAAFISKMDYVIENTLTAETERLGVVLTDRNLEAERKGNKLILKIDDNQKLVLAEIAGTNVRVTALEKDAWLPRMLNTSIHKAVIALIGIIFLMAVTNMGVWALSKSFLFKETPLQQQQINAMMEKYIADKGKGERP